MERTPSNLKEVKVELIDRNKENPRILFRQDEMEELLNSIHNYGVQVPIVVYKEGKRFVLIDGERRWRCCKKLGWETIPALVQEAPDPLRNLLLMFNIHSLREQWDLLTIAMKLPRVIDLLRSELKREPVEKEICEKTGLNRAIYRRCKLLIELPGHYKDDLLKELHKPKSQQRLTEDFFIEMERALKTVERSHPAAMLNKDDTRDILIRKYKTGVIKNIVHFRYLAKMARGSLVEVPDKVSLGSLQEVLGDNQVPIEQIYEERFANAYNERGLISRLQGVIDGLERLEPEDVDEEMRSRLIELVSNANRLLEPRSP